MVEEFLVGLNLQNGKLSPGGRGQFSVERLPEAVSFTEHICKALILGREE